MVECIEYIVRQTAEQINNKPRLKIIHSNDLRVTDNLTAGSNECCVEI